jgi:hypothetical protein
MDPTTSDKGKTSAPVRNSMSWQWTLCSCLVWTAVYGRAGSAMATNWRIPAGLLATRSIRWEGNIQSSPHTGHRRRASEHHYAPSVMIAMVSATSAVGRSGAPRHSAASSPMSCDAMVHPQNRQRRQQTRHGYLPSSYQTPREDTTPVRQSLTAPPWCPASRH